MNITYRSSTVNDVDHIDTLLKVCFGDRAKYGALDRIEGRYVLCFDDGNLVAMTGLSVLSDFNGYEIDWTCVHPDYRHSGLITEMLRRCVEDISSRIYCSCFRLPGKSKVNLYHAMEELGFRCIIMNYKTYDSMHMKACEDCIYRLQEGCSCHEDLYVRY